jgi:hypothetical protein
MDVGVRIPSDDSVRLLVHVVHQLNVGCVFQSYDTYQRERRRREAEQKSAAAVKGAELAVPPEETAGTAASSREGEEKQKEGRPPCDIMVLLCVVLYAYMEGIYSSRGIAKACRVNINFMYLLQGNSAPSHGMINAFRKHVLGPVME